MKNFDAQLFYHRDNDKKHGNWERFWVWITPNFSVNSGLLKSNFVEILRFFAIEPVRMVVWIVF
jgi:hypothetical protein